MLYPALRASPARQQWTERFLGLDRRPRASEGAFEAMGNLCGQPWPLLSSRDKRGVAAELERPLGLLAMEKLAWIDGNTLYYGGMPTPVQGLSLEADMLPKRMVSMGAYLLVFPDGVYYNTADPSDYGSINRLYETGENQETAFSLCDGEGEPYPAGAVTASAQAPAAPQPGDYWLDTSAQPRTLRRWQEEWQAVESVYVRISAPGIGAGLNLRDGVTLSGIQGPENDEALAQQLSALNATHLVQAVGEDYLVVVGVIDRPYTQTHGTIRADRKAPQMDFVVSCGNRLWGCRYGRQGEERVNMLYACALGDFRNWNRFSGTSQDSYFVHLGSDGPFTGAAAFRDCPCFFKEKCLHRVLGEVPANFQTQTTLCEGVRPGAEATLTAYNDALYYLGSHGVQRFDGLPQPVSQALGEKQPVAGAAGAMNGVYYFSAQETAGGWSLYTLDLERGLWHRQDDSHALAFAALNGEMYMLCQNGMLYALNGKTGQLETEDVTWYCETPPMGYAYPENQYLRRLTLRLLLEEGAECRLYAQYDGDGVWREKGALQGRGRVKMYLVPLTPRRCETLRLRLEGHGKMRLYGLARVLSAGSDGGIKAT